MATVTDMDIEKAKRNLERYLETRIPDFQTMSENQAKDVMSMAVFRVWTAWAVLSGRL